ncbi:transposase [Holospora curviuscula]|nr:transposase [Holospora curviuscula]
MGSNLGAIRLLTDSVEVLMCWVAQMFLPNIPENCGIVMDNTAFHQGKAMQKIIKNAGHTLFYLPPYYPDLNPIEKQ